MSGATISTPALEPQEAFAALGQIRFDDNDLDSVLMRVAELAKRTVPRVADVSVTLVRGQDAFTAAFTGEDALKLDESQYEPGHGPCLDVAQSSGRVVIRDMATESRWPDFTARALSCGVHSCLSLALPVQQAIVGSLNLYSHESEAFDEASEELAQTFAGYAAVAIANAHMVDASASLAENMRRAMERRSVIEQAKGILIALHGYTPEEAFAVLTTTSQQTNRKLHDVAVDLVATIGRAAEEPVD